MPTPTLRRTSLALLLSLASATVLASCGGGDGAADSGGESGAGLQADAAGASGTGVSAADAPDSAPGEWRDLFDGATLDGWQAHQTPGEAPPSWAVEEGTLTRVAAGGDLVTVDQFANFELEFEWRVPPGGNSGVLYRIDPAVEVTYQSAPEYQVLDDALHRDGQSRLTSAGAAYGLYPSPEGHTRPVGEWNAGRIVVSGAQVEHWLNGTMVVEYTLGSPDWEQKVRDSKFNDWPAYGRAARGPIALQDHGDRVSFRNIRIRELP